MINRILIRIKVVQMLYSYLLTRSEFHLESEPTSPGRDAKFAYKVYLNLLLVILELSGYRVDAAKARKNPMESLGEANMLSSNKLASALIADSEVKALIAKGVSGVEAYDAALLRLYSLITRSAAYIDYSKKKRHDLEEDVKFWCVVLNTIIASNPLVLEAARTDEEFTLVGFQKGVEMLYHTLSNYNDVRLSLLNAKKSLNESLDKAYELYHALLLLPVFITDMERERIESAKAKYCPSDHDLNPNMRFVENALIERIRNNADMEAYLKKNPVTWEADFFLLKELMDKIRESEAYRNYMEAEETGYAADCELWRTLMRTVVLPSDALAEALEAKSVYWNDDLTIMGTFVLKSIKHFAASEDKEVNLLPVYKDEEDAKFGPELFTDAIKNRELYRSYIDRFINGNSWDPERIAFMDIVILTTAISELVNFPNIPMAVTMNEYIEIANYYSTARSGQFINGLLYSVANCLREEGKIVK